tara:strand:- start:81 stop:206 length:126 start_codon:yes stop_codon:yes gene_type:complete
MQVTSEEEAVAWVMVMGERREKDIAAIARRDSKERISSLSI